MIIFFLITFVSIALFLIILCWWYRCSSSWSSSCTSDVVERHLHLGVHLQVLINFLFLIAFVLMPSSWSSSTWSPLCWYVQAPCLLLMITFDLVLISFMQFFIIFLPMIVIVLVLITSPNRLPPQCPCPRRSCLLLSRSSFSPLSCSSLWYIVQVLVLPFIWPSNSLWLPSHCHGILIPSLASPVHRLSYSHLLQRVQSRPTTNLMYPSCIFVPWLLAIVHTTLKTISTPLSWGILWQRHGHYELLFWIGIHLVCFFSYPHFFIVVFFALSFFIEHFALGLFSWVLSVLPRVYSSSFLTIFFFFSFFVGLSVALSLGASFYISYIVQPFSSCPMCFDSYFRRWPCSRPLCCILRWNIS